MATTVAIASKSTPVYLALMLDRSRGSQSCNGDKFTSKEEAIQYLLKLWDKTQTSAGSWFVDMPEECKRKRDLVQAKLLDGITVGQTHNNGKYWHTSEYAVFVLDDDAFASQATTIVHFYHNVSHCGECYDIDPPQEQE